MESLLQPYSDFSTSLKAFRNFSVDLSSDYEYAHVVHSSVYNVSARANSGLQLVPIVQASRVLEF